MPTLYTDNGIDRPNRRWPSYPIDPIFKYRWSPRSFDPAPIPREVLMTIFEAARWTMSCFNDQPWMFVVADTDDQMDKFRGLLTGANQVWAKDVPVLGFIFARRRFAHNDKDNDWGAFDCGAAWMALTLQARMLGLYTHGMAGFDQKKVYEALNVPESDYRALIAFALGRIGDKEKLPDEMQKQEQPSDRVALFETVNFGYLE